MRSGAPCPVAVLFYSACLALGTSGVRIRFSRTLYHTGGKYVKEKVTQSCTAGTLTIIISFNSNTVVVVVVVVVFTLRLR